MCEPQPSAIVYLVSLVVVTTWVLCVGAPPLLAQQQPVAAPQTAQAAVPVNPPPPKPAPAVSPQASALGQSQSDPTRDICGNKFGTLYTEGMPCRQLESRQGPYITYKTPWETNLTILSLGLALCFLGLYCAMLMFSRERVDEVNIRYFVIIAVIGSAVFILTAGYDDKQAAPLYALFGTLVGYLFGMSQAETERSREQPTAEKLPAGNAHPTSKPSNPNDAPGLIDKPVNQSALEPQPQPDLTDTNGKES
ncbi:hypothetical protein ACQZ6A_18125 [Agrobacterium vitis]